MTMTWMLTDEAVSRSERGSECTVQRRWKVASAVLNVDRSSPSGVGVMVCSSSVAIGLAVSPCRKKVVEPDGVLRFVVPGPRLKVPDTVAGEGLISRPSRSTTVVGNAAEGSGSMQIKP
jgi:hypothetical protein